MHRCHYVHTYLSQVTIISGHPSYNWQVAIVVRLYSLQGTFHLVRTKRKAPSLYSECVPLTEPVCRSRRRQHLSKLLPISDGEIASSQPSETSNGNGAAFNCPTVKKWAALFYICNGLSI